MENHRVVKSADVQSTNRENYSYQRYIVNSEEQPFNFIRVQAHGIHPARSILYGIRNYYVVSGEGDFSVAGEDFKAEVGMLITIRPGEVYSYKGMMEMIEFNIPTEGKIEHEDVNEK